jgi:Ca2+/Na+ antiporter
MKELDYLIEAEDEAKAKEVDSSVREAIKTHAFNVFQFSVGLVLLGIGAGVYFTQINYLIQVLGVSVLLLGAVLVYFSFQH